MLNFNVNNFRSFQNQKFNFSKINILIGENSGGKSSLLKLLLALKQTLDYPFEGNLKLVGDFTDLGNYEEVVYYKNKRKNISIGFEGDEKYYNYFLEMIKKIDEKLTQKEEAKIKKIIEDYKDSTTSVIYTFNSKLNDHSTIKTVIKNDKIGSLEIIQHKSSTTPTFSNRFPDCDLKFKFKDKIGIIENCSAVKDGFLTLLEIDLKKKCKNLFGEESDYVFYSIAFMLVYQNYVKAQLVKIRYVNPIGNSPKRIYFQEDRKANYKSIDIEKFINILGDKSLTEKNYKEKIETLNKIIKDFGIADALEIIKDKQLPILALNVKTKDFWSNITDVGYGVSLQIPIIFQAMMSEYYSQSGETILIEQPEVHLHPSLQAKFIETLLGMGSRNIYFIETHSEHIIRKLQVLVKNKKYGIKPTDISIHYFKRESLQFNISEHKILSNGQLEPVFPDGFYDTSYSLVKQLIDDSTIQ